MMSALAATGLLDLSALKLGSRERLPSVLQTEAAECGLACMAMIASYHGHRTDLATLRGRFQISLKGITLNQMIQVADALHLASRPLRVEMEYLPQLKLPCILHWDFNHFVVLRKAGNERVVIHDPASGVRKLSYAELSKHFTGVALELTPTQTFKPRQDKQRVRLRDVMGQAVGLNRALAQILLLALALEVFVLVSPFYMQWVVDGVLISADRDLLTLLGGGFVLLVLMQHGIGALRSWVVLYVSTLLSTQWLTNAFTHLLKLPTSFFEKRHMGDVFSRFQSINTIQHTLTTSFVEAVLDGIMALVTLGMMLIYSPGLTLLAGAAVLLYGLLRWGWYQPLRSATEEQIVHAAKQQTHFFETVRGVRSIQLFNRQSERRSTWLNLLADQINADLRSQKLNLVYRTLNGGLFGIERVGVIWLAALLVLDNKFSVGMLFAFIAYKDQFALRVTGLIDKFVDLKMLQLQAERLADILLTPAEEDISLIANARQQVEPSIELKNVRFRYADGEPYVLDGINLLVKSGESIAIIGPSGCGKTTLLKVMIGLLPPNEGEILVGGVPMKQLGAGAFRSMAGTVLQDDQLFAGSIAQNICFFDPNSDQQRIETCARLASIHDEVMQMPMRYNTLIGDMGTALSGGQQQRVLLARAMYKQPKILFLDEATSHLDVAREKAVNAAVQQIDLTRVIIAHRPDTIAMAGRVIRLDSGKVVQDFRRAIDKGQSPNDPQQLTQESDRA